MGGDGAMLATSPVSCGIQFFGQPVDIYVIGINYLPSTTMDAWAASWHCRRVSGCGSDSDTNVT